MLLFLLTTPLAVYFAWLANITDTPTTPGGMLALEFPGTRSGALAALALLDQAAGVPGAVGRSAVTNALLWDFGLIVCYSIALWLATQWAVQRRFTSNGTASTIPVRRMVDRFAILAPFVAGAFDALENVLLFAFLNWSEGKHLAGVLASAITAFACAKFTLLVFVMLYLACSFVIIAASQYRTAVNHS